MDENAKSPRGRESLLLVLSRQSAERLRERDLFDERAVDCEDVLKRLGLTLRFERNLQVQGILLQLREVVVRAGISDTNRRLVILHEAGHAVLHRDYPNLVESLTLRDKEFFANNFAIDMLIPQTKRAELSRHLATIERPSEFAKLASSLGISIRTLFQLALWQQLDAAPGTIWLQVRATANRYTKQDIKLRIVSAHYDRSRWFVPTNKSLSGLLGDTSWMDRIPIGTECCKDDLTFSIHKVVDESSRKYRLESLSGTICAMAIRPFAGSIAPQYVVTVSVESA